MQVPENTYFDGKYYNNPYYYTLFQLILCRIFVFDYLAVLCAILHCAYTHYVMCLLYIGFHCFYEVLCLAAILALYWIGLKVSLK